jgi:hypothetical protein
VPPTPISRRSPAPASFRPGTSATSSSEVDDAGQPTPILTRIRSQHRRRRNHSIAVALLAAGFAVAILGLIYLTESAGNVVVERDAERAKVADVARDITDVATPIAALCNAGGDAAAALDAAGLCGRAAEALANPVVAARPEALSQAEIEEIVARVRALSPAPASVDDVVDAVLLRLASDPTLRGLNETEVRAIVLAVLADTPPPPGADGAPGRDGTAFGGLTFGRQGGRCVAVVTFIDPDGSTRTQTSPVGDGACDGPRSEPGPSVPDEQPGPSIVVPTGAPDPTSAPEPEPEPNVAPPEPEPEPVPEPEPPAPTPPPPVGGGVGADIAAMVRSGELRRATDAPSVSVDHYESVRWDAGRVEPKTVEQARAALAARVDDPAAPDTDPDAYNEA